jgi:hypothetical protein
MVIFVNVVSVTGRSLKNVYTFRLLGYNSKHQVNININKSRDNNVDDSRNRIRLCRSAARSLRMNNDIQVGRL